ncbi:MAG: hypothetical protein RLZZ241_1207, partial [Bacteroidota bacterium]
MNTEKAKQLQVLLETPQQIVIIPHRNPDGDAIGSSLGLSGFLNACGHKSHVLAPNDFPDFLKWMPGANQITYYEEDVQKGVELLQVATLIFTLDFNALNRTGIMAQELAAVH